MLLKENIKVKLDQQNNYELSIQGVLTFIDNFFYLKITNKKLARLI